jgi:DNA-binding transcriptional ArsR family regulator
MTLAALAAPHRREIAEYLRVGPRHVNQIVDHLGLKQPQVSKHLRVLADAGIVSKAVDGPRRIYSLNPKPLRELVSWLDLFADLWTERLDNLDSFLREPLADQPDGEDW